MVRVVAALLVLTMLTGCGRVRESNFNPFNWFGGGRDNGNAAQQVEGEVNPLIPRSRESIFRRNEDNDHYTGRLVAAVTAVRIDQRQGGILLQADGRTVRQGAYDVRLVLRPDTAGTPTHVYELKAQQPTNRGLGAEATRNVTAGLALTTQDLLGVNSIEIVAEGNSRAVRP
ncbi:MAG: hypothetical protein MK098_02360 [Marinovum sp.]|nr:hypothetical protein [Marinovum sp.]